MPLFEVSVTSSPSLRAGVGTLGKSQVAGGHRARSLTPLSMLIFLLYPTPPTPEFYSRHKGEEYGQNEFLLLMLSIICFYLTVE